jgi:hypothetical protein
MMMILTVEPGIPTPPHSHPPEQIGCLIKDEECQRALGKRQGVKKLNR